NGLAAADGVGVSDCACSLSKAAKRETKSSRSAECKFTGPTVLVAKKSTSGKVGTARCAVRIVLRDAILLTDAAARRPYLSGAPETGALPGQASVRCLPSRRFVPRSLSAADLRIRICA